MYLSIRDAMVAEGDFSSPAAGMKELGIEAAEIALERDFKVPAMDSKEKLTLKNDSDAKDYKKHLESLGIRACAFLTACDFSAADMETNIRWVTRALELADMMGMPAIRIDSAMRRERELDFETRVDLFARGLGAALGRTPGLKVAMGIENHGFQGNNLAFLLNVYQRVGSDRLGSTMDTGNFYWRGYPLSEVYGILRILAPHTKHTHLKNIKYPEGVRESTREAGWQYGTYVSPLDEGDIDHAKVLRMLKDAGYRGDICIEDESLGHYKQSPERIAVLKRDVAHLKSILQRLG
ncbi:MAG: sugar phosphate isomerase/epimerase [Candidatus Hydrogenedentes bacterium]|nr:sugar phosphate isomerase/epimerase [Candidatus Hydrogenedentota bacterium]